MTLNKLRVSVLHSSTCQNGMIKLPLFTGMVWRHRYSHRKPQQFIWCYKMCLCSQLGQARPITAFISGSFLFLLVALSQSPHKPVWSWPSPMALGGIAMKESRGTAWKVHLYHQPLLSWYHILFFFIQTHFFPTNSWFQHGLRALVRHWNTTTEPKATVPSEAGVAFSAHIDLDCHLL